jgi:transcriptional regulator with XRE-family HTH domain
MLMPIGQRLHHRRQQVGWSQEELAQASGVPQSAISRIEHGQRNNPGVEAIRRFARALGVTADWLIGMYEAAEEEPAQAMAAGEGARGRHMGLRPQRVPAAQLDARSRARRVRPPLGTPRREPEPPSRTSV